MNSQISIRDIVLQQCLFNDNDAKLSHFLSNRYKLYHKPASMVDVANGRVNDFITLRSALILANRIHFRNISGTTGTLAVFEAQYNEKYTMYTGTKYSVIFCMFSLIEFFGENKASTPVIKCILITFDSSASIVNFTII